jgi:cobalt-zinc-cadmium efflux system protein
MDENKERHHHDGHSSSSHHHSGSSSSHSSEHSHSHSHVSTSKALNALKVCIGINAIYLIAEALIGMKENSLSLVTDAGYNLGDVLVLALAYFSLRLRSTPSYQLEAATYKKYSALSLLINSVILLVAVGFVTLLAWNKIRDGFSHCSAGLAMTVTAGVGIIVNGLTAWILRKNSKHSTGMKSAFVNMMADTFVSVVVMAAGIVLLINPASTLADPIATIIAAIVILCFTVKLLYVYLKKGFLMFPEHIDTAKVLNVLKSNDHVMNCRHLNIWKNSADELEVSAHLSLDDMTAVELVKKEAKHSLRHMGFEIVTLSFKRHKE